MTPRSLFNIILKVLGIFFIKDILVTIAPIFAMIPHIAKPDPEAMPVGVLLIYEQRPLANLIERQRKKR
jgi:hypothetical protein